MNSLMEKLEKKKKKKKKLVIQSKTPNELSMKNSVLSNIKSK